MSHFNNVNVGVTGFVFDSRYTFTGLGYLAVCWQKQWGYQTVHGTNHVTYDLPIPFEEAPFTVAISTGNSGNHASCGGFTKTTIVLRAGTTAGVWDTVGFFIVGCQQQWGENVGGGGQTVSLPISFEVAFTAVVSADSSWCNASCHITTTTITTMNYQSNRPDIAQAGPVQWLAIGIQPQWGYCVGKNNVTFPIPFNSVWTVLGNAHGSNNSNNDHYFLGEFSTTGARFYYSNMNLTGTAWIAIGDC